MNPFVVVVVVVACVWRGCNHTLQWSTCFFVFFDKQFWRSSSSVSVCCGGHFAGMVWAHLSP